MALRDAQHQVIKLSSQPFAHGGEGEVYAVLQPAAYQHCCAKIYHPNKRDQERRDKLSYMVVNPPPELESSGYRICWPQSLLFDDGQFCGFIMPLAFADSHSPYRLCNPKIKKDLPQSWHRKYDRQSAAGRLARLKLCVNIAIAVHTIHRTGRYVLLDLKPQNMLVTVDGKVSVIDFDSTQIAENQRVLFYGSAATVEYMPPEADRSQFTRQFIPEYWDRFSLAVLFYQLLTGVHPYAGTVKERYGEISSLAEKISHGLFVYGSKAATHIAVKPPLHDTYYKQLDPGVRRLFVKAFDEGHTNMPARPSAEEWGQTLYKVIRKEEATMKPEQVQPQMAPPVPPRPQTVYSAPSQAQPYSRPASAPPPPAGTPRRSALGIVLFIAFALLVLAGGWMIYREIQGVPGYDPTDYAADAHEPVREQPVAPPPEPEPARVVETEPMRVVREFIENLADNPGYSYDLSANRNWPDRDLFVSTDGYGGIAETQLLDYQQEGDDRVRVRYYARDPVNDQRNHGTTAGVDYEQVFTVRNIGGSYKIVRLSTQSMTPR